MGRRGWAAKKSFVEGERSTIPTAQMEKAIGEIDRCCAREVTMMVPQRFNVEQILPWFFPDDTLAKLRAVKGMVETDSTKQYQVLPDIDLILTYRSSSHVCSVPAIEQKCWQPHPQRSQPMLEAIRQIAEVHFKYGRVKHMLRWFNKHATPGAVRNYWPAAMSLCPDSEIAKMMEAPSRYSVPVGIGDVLPLIRETAGTVATMALVPADIQVHSHNNIRLRLNSCGRDWEGLSVMLDTQIFNL